MKKHIISTLASIGACFLAAILFAILGEEELAQWVISSSIISCPITIGVLYIIEAQL